VGRGPVVIAIAIWFTGPSGIGIAGWVLQAGEKIRGNKDRVQGLPGTCLGNLRGMGGAA